MPARVCLRCGQLSSHASPRGLCPECQSEWEQERPARATYDSAAWRELSRRAIGRHLRRLGYWCTGWGVPGHRSYDLTADHPQALAAGGARLPALEDITVLCRACNGRKAANPATPPGGTAR